MKRAWLLVACLGLAVPVLAEEEGEEREGPREAAVSEAEEREILDFVGANAPEMKEHLSRAKENHPLMYKRRLREISHMYKDPEIREHFVKMNKARRQVEKLARTYREDKGDAKAKEASKKELERAVGEVFDLDVAQKEMQIKKMHNEISKLKEKIAKRRSVKDQLVKKRVEKMAGEGDEWEW